MTRLVQMCFNWKVLLGLAVVGLGIWVVAPNMVLTALPLLLLAACPLSMLGMMWGMRDMHREQAGTASASRLPVTYACPMHPEMRDTGTGDCPKCGMQLVPTGQPAEGKTRASSSKLSREQQLAELKAQHEILAQKIAALEVEAPRTAGMPQQHPANQQGA